MSKHKDVYNMIIRLYENKKHKDVIDKVDKYLSLNFNKKWDHNLKFVRAKSLRYLGYFDEAIDELRILSKKDDDNLYSTLELFYIYYHLNRYEEALKLLPRLYVNKTKHVANYSLLIAELVMKKSLGMNAEFKRGTRSDYIKEQILDYNEQNAITHIFNHTNETQSYGEHSKFNKDIDILYLIECVKNNLLTHKKENVNDVLEIHLFSVPNIGYDSINLCNYIKVVVVPNTTNIISIYPYSAVEVDNVDILNCDINKLFKRKVEQKTISRIDKFNKRFNLK